MGAREQILAEAAKAAMEERGLHVRGLARDLAADPEADGAVVETWRRQIYRVLEGGAVSDPVRRRLIADRLGLSDEMLAPAQPASRRSTPPPEPTMADLEALVVRLEEATESLHRLRVQASEEILAQLEAQTELLGTLRSEAESLRALRSELPSPRADERTA